MAKEAEQAIQAIAKLEDNRHRTYAVHYACSGLTAPEGGSPAVACIAVANLDGDIVGTFDSGTHGDEKTALNAFFDFLRQDHNRVFVHWNMSSSTYGFLALANRLGQLSGQAVVLPGFVQFDLDRLLEQLHGARYVDHPKLLSLANVNRYTTLDMLTGEEEAHAVADGRISEVRASTARKVKVVSRVARDLLEGRLRVRSSRWAQVLDAVENNVWYRVLVMVAALVTVVSTVYLILKALGRL